MAQEFAVQPELQECTGQKDLNIIQLAGDASNRRYYRVMGGEKSWVLMVWDPFEDNGKYPFLSVLRHFEKNDIHVPEVVGLWPQKGWVLLEDLGDLTLERKFWESQDQSNVLPFYEKAIDELIKIHYVASANKSPCTAFENSFDVEKLLWELNYGKSHLLEKMNGIKFSDIENKEIEKVFLDICKILHQQPKYICHRDYHSRNLMLKLDKMRVIDFQDARMGPIHYDLVSLLKDSYIDLDKKYADQLLEYYFDQRKRYSAAPIPRAEFDEVYEIQSIQRCFKACGSFSSFFNTREDKRYLKYIGPTLKRVKKSLSLFPKYKVFFEILEQHDVLNRDYNTL